MTMRRSLAHHLTSALARAEMGKLGFAALRAGAARLDLDLPEAWRGPLLATFAITWACPLRCAMCDLPARAGAEIPDAEIPAWIDSIAALRPLGLGFTGGEPLVRTDALLDAISRAANHGLVTHLNTSGIGLSAETADRLLASGLASVNVSIDHYRPGDHDRLRGRNGALHKALAALEQLARARLRSGRVFRIQVMMAVGADTICAVGEVARLAKEHGADALSLLPVHDFTANPSPAATTTPRALDLEGIVDLALENSPEYLAGIAPFLAGNAMPGTCSAPRTGLFLDPTGAVFACTPGATLGRRGVPATPATLATLVRAGAVARTAPEEFCRRCWWNCHRELDIATAIGAITAP